MRWLRRISQQVGRLLAELTADAGQSAAQCIVRWLDAKIGEQSGETRIRLDISKANLAASLNMTPENFSRVLKHLREVGVLRVDGRKIVVPNPACLRSLQPRVYCSKPAAEDDFDASDELSEWERLIALRSECDVPHWFGEYDCARDLPHWCGGVAHSQSVA